MFSDFYWTWILCFKEYFKDYIYDCLKLMKKYLMIKINFILLLKLYVEIFSIFMFFSFLSNLNNFFIII